MLKVFIAEDESIVREGLRDSIPWEEYGFCFVGDAMDGETALPMILETRPDLLITDIRMPFMDGLELSRRVREEAPDTHIVILSGYDEFDYAQRAIELQVDRYLLKPIMKAEMIKMLEDVRGKIEEENEKKSFIARFTAEQQGYEQYSRVLFLNELLSGKLQGEELEKRCAGQGLHPGSGSFAAVVLMLQPGTAYSEQAAAAQELLLQRLQSREDYLLYRSGALNYCVLLEAAPECIAQKTEECLALLQDAGSRCDSSTVWYAAGGRPVDAAEELRESFADALRLLGYRHFLGGKHILRQADVDGMGSSGALDAMDADPMAIRSFIKTGLPGETEEFVAEYIQKAGDSVHSVLFRNYLIVSVRINAAAVLQEIGIGKESYIAALPPARADMREEELAGYMTEILRTALTLRDNAAQSSGGDIVNSAAAYVDAHFAEENLSLNMVAKAVNISPNYLSAVFSQKTGMPFVEYITNKRMERAKELLRQTNRRSGEIGAEVGYRDPRYFSFVFKKTQGCTPKEYRSGETEK